MPYSFNKKGIFPAGMVSFARPGARSGLGSVPVSRRRFSGHISSALLSTSTHVFFSNPTPVLQSAFIPVILSAAKDLSSVPAAPLEKKILRRCAPQDDKEPEQISPPCHPERSEGSFPPVPAVSLEKKILRRCAPQDDKEREVFLGMTEKRRSVPQNDKEKGKCFSG